MLYCSEPLILHVQHNVSLGSCGWHYEDDQICGLGEFLCGDPDLPFSCYVFWEVRSILTCGLRAGDGGPGPCGAVNPATEHAAGSYAEATGEDDAGQS
jgi:hypothetical protein